MRVWMALALSFLLVLAPTVHADDHIQMMMEELALIDSAAPLLNMAASAMQRHTKDLQSAPDAELAWHMLGRYVNDLMGYRETPFESAELANAYAQMFAEGSFSDIEALECAPFERVEGGYRYAFGDGDAWELAVENACEKQPDGRLALDMSVYTDSNGAGQWFCFNASAVLEPAPESVFGARIVRFVRSEAALPVAMAAVSATELDGYQAGNVLDGNLHTCWACDAGAENASIGLNFPEPTAVRGLVIAPGHMKSVDEFERNERPAVVTVKTSNGATRAFDLRDVGLGFGCAIVLPFGEVETVTDISIDVDEVEHGTTDRRICVAEIGIF